MHNIVAINVYRQNVYILAILQRFPLVQSSVVLRTPRVKKLSLVFGSQTHGKENLTKNVKYILKIFLNVFLDFFYLGNKDSILLRGYEGKFWGSIKKRSTFHLRRISFFLMEGSLHLEPCVVFR